MLTPWISDTPEWFPPTQSFPRASSSVRKQMFSQKYTTARQGFEEVVSHSYKSLYLCTFLSKRVCWDACSKNTVL